MKKIIAIAAIVASTQTFAFFNDGNVSNAFVQDGRGNANGNATGSAEGTFGMNFEADGDTSGSFLGNNAGNFRNDVNYVDAYDSNGNYIGKVATSTHGNGNGRAKGGAKFGMTFSGRANGNADMKADGNFNGNHESRGYGYDRPYYQFPVAPVK